ncbi:MAG: riboflavin biosynthesis protein RibF [Oscillospiraceae bacterium]|nr:riboflavin biosynthesis protein RibF [Oscillospiraceae bacterium]
MAESKRAIALGFFDGVHIGHAALLRKTKQRAEELGVMPSVLSFDVHPDTLVFQKDVPLINSALGREDLIRRLFGIDNVIFIHFNQRVMRMSWRDFADSVIEELHAAWVVVGHDFSFGYRGEGKPDKLRDYCAERGVGCDIIPAVELDGEIVSSTRIRELLLAGEIEEANRRLGHPHFLTDTVHSGYHLGTKLGTPTINMSFPEGVLVPRRGVYAAKVYLAGETEGHIAVTNVGVRPTVSDEGRLSVESHLLDYADDLYGRQARVEFYSFLRDERKYADFGALSAQIRLDMERARAWFAENNG